MIKKILETLPLLLIGVVIPLLGRPELMTTWPILVITIYGFLLSISQPSMTSKDETNHRDRKSMQAILFGALTCFILPICDYAYGKPRSIEINQVTSIVGLCMIGGGFAFRYWAIHVLGRFFTSKVHIHSDHQLIRDKPYQWLRHPSYTGAWVSQLGISTLLQSRMGIVFCIFVYFPIYIYRIECEEKALKETFGTAYAEYQSKTSKMFPWLY